MTNSRITRNMNTLIQTSSILVLLISLSEAIRVDWNTNTGPIVPPVPTQQPRPKPPFREPAPVWEDQSDDIPNPNPYVYVLPPTSRPKLINDNYLRAPSWQHQQQQQRQNFGQILPYPNNRQNNVVPSLGVQYIPNVGYKYSAVVPNKSYYLQQNDIYDHHQEKLNDRYNAKLKKYKEYEAKLKYFPQNQVHQANQYQFAVQPQQQLPAFQAPQPFRTNSNLNQQQLPLQQNPIQFNSQIGVQKFQPSFPQPTNAKIDVKQNQQQPQQQHQQSNQNDWRINQFTKITSQPVQNPVDQYSAYTSAQTTRATATTKPYTN